MRLVANYGSYNTHVFVDLLLKVTDNTQEVVVKEENNPLDTGRKLGVHKTFRTSYVGLIYNQYLGGSEDNSYLYYLGVMAEYFKVWEVYV